MALRPNRTQGLTTRARGNLRAAVDSWERNEPGRIVTPQAYEIIIQAISAIKTDPSQQWIIEDHNILQYQQDEMINNIPDTLSRLAHKAKTKRIDTFTLLHSISDLLDSICPFDKPNESRLQQMG